MTFMHHPWRGAFLFLIVLPACATAPEDHPKPDPKLIKQADKVFEFFKQCIRSEEYARAYEVLSVDTKKRITGEEFYFLFTRFSVMKRLIEGTLQHAAEVKPDQPTATITLCNNEFGLSRKFLVRKHLIVMWTIELTPDQIDEFKKLARRWYDQQTELMGERKYAIPPWWRYRQIASKPCEHMPK